MTQLSRPYAILLGLAVAHYVATPSSACSSRPPPERVAIELRETINAADYVFIGQIERVTKRRWGLEDQMGWYETNLLGYRGEGRELPEAAQRVLTYSDAEARISIRLSLKNDGLDQIGGRSYRDPEVDVDLLRPVRSPGDGNCTSFPMPCPWDVKVGEWVAVALEAKPFGLPATSYCIKIAHPNLAQSETIRLLRETDKPAEVIWPFVIAAMPELIGRPRIDVSPKPRPAPNRP